MVLHNLIRREILVLDLSYIILVDKKNYDLCYNQCMKKYIFKMNIVEVESKKYGKFSKSSSSGSQSTCYSPVNSSLL